MAAKGRMNFSDFLPWSPGPSCHHLAGDGLEGRNQWGNVPTALSLPLSPLAVETLVDFCNPTASSVTSDLSSLRTVFGLALSKPEGNQHVAMVCSAAHPKVSSRLCEGCRLYPWSTDV